jgi:hypothetical protein
MPAILTTTTAPIASNRGVIVSAPILRAGMLTLVAGAVIAGFLITGTKAADLAVARDGADLTRVLRFMAAIKMVIAIAGLAAVLWRLGSAISLPWFAAYAVTCASMAIGPGLIWSMSHVALGALLLHGGLFGTIILLWRDPSVGARLAVIVAARRRHIASRMG